eukprot:a692_22.p1 GENE.a692_22~~a692_22.p1  ORF type:complete len:351 (+),score=110.39 a692_22:59-1054(+)
MDANEVELATVLRDGVSSLDLSTQNGTTFLLAASWDQTVYLHNIDTNMLSTHVPNSCPVLDARFLGASLEIAHVGVDSKVTLVDLTSGLSTELGSHDAPARTLRYSDAVRSLVTGSWDKTMRIWDPRAAGRATATVQLPDKAFALDTTGYRVVVGTAGRHVHIYDVRMLGGEPEQRRESSLKHQTRCIAANPSGTGYALSSIEGRVSLEFFDLSPAAQAQKFAFKCHRVKGDDGVETAFPVNALAFHSGFGTFASGGCDGFVNVWDGANRKRVSQLRRYPTSIAALAFSQNGQHLAIASSYTHEEGEKEHPRDQIFIRRVLEAEVAPRAKA